MKVPQVCAVPFLSVWVVIATLQCCQPYKKEFTSLRSKTCSIDVTNVLKPTTDNSGNSQRSYNNEGKFRFIYFHFFYQGSPIEITDLLHYICHNFNVRDYLIDFIFYSHRPYIRLWRPRKEFNEVMFCEETILSNFGQSSQYTNTLLTLLYCVLLCSILFCVVLFFYTLSYCTLFHCTVLYYILFYCILFSSLKHEEELG